MKKALNIIICISFLFAANVFTQTRNGKSRKFTNKKTVKIRTVKNTANEDVPSCKIPPSVYDLAVSQTEIFSDCSLSGNNCEKIIEIRAVANDPGNEVLKYVYTVSGGKIIGEGPNVKWDMSNVNPGTYTITAGISLAVWGVQGKTITKSVIVKECSDCK